MNSAWQMDAIVDGRNGHWMRFIRFWSEKCDYAKIQVIYFAFFKMNFVERNILHPMK